MSHPITIFLICFFKMTMAATPSSINYLVIRNVGQGQWATHVSYDHCLHFDFGGELFKYKDIRPKLRQQCFNKTNVLYLSHADWDHYSFLPLLLRTSKKICWGHKAIDSLINVELTSTIPFCEKILTTKNQIVFYSPYEKNKNSRSIVVRFKNFLIPGDSPISMEKKWVSKIHPQDIKYLIVGHHGSRSSTGNKLLAYFNKMDLAIVSARTKKYNHPHPDTVSRLKRSRVPVLKTEDWGDIVIH